VEWVDPRGLQVVIPVPSPPIAFPGQNGRIRQNGSYYDSIPLEAVGLPRDREEAYRWRENRYEIDKAGLKVSPIAATMKPPGDCDPGQHRELQDEVNTACKSKPIACKGNMDQISLIINREDNRRCAMARDKINKVCFKGGDEIHRNQAIDAWSAVANCEKFMK
jgi:type VI secretion system secreted protein VgrG